MTTAEDPRQLSEDHKGAVVHCCLDCATEQGWDLARPLEELPQLQ